MINKRFCTYEDLFKGLDKYKEGTIIIWRDIKHKIVFSDNGTAGQPQNTVNARVHFTQDEAWPTSDQTYYVDIDIITPKKNKVKVKKPKNRFDEISKIIKSKYEECLRDLKEQ